MLVRRCAPASDRRDRSWRRARRARRSARRRSSRAWPRTSKPVRCDQRGQQRVVERRGAPAADVDDLEPVDRRRPTDHARAPRPPPAVRSGAKRWLTTDDGSVGHDVAGHAALDPHRLQGLAVLAAVDDRPALLVGARAGASSRRRGGGWRCGPSTAGRCGPARRASVTLDAHRALAPGLDRARRSARRARRRRRRAGRGARANSRPRPLCAASTSSHA